MTFLGLKGPTEAETAASETASSSIRTELIKKLALGGGVTVGGSIVWGAFQLLHDNAKDAFPLLRSWGPWAFVTLVALYVVYDITKIVLNLALRAILAWEASATAAQALADKDDRHTQQQEVLMTTVVVQTKGVMRRLHSLGSALARLEDKAGIIRPAGTDEDEVGEQ